MPISVRLGKDVEARLEQLAKLTGAQRPITSDKLLSKS
jgi:predicted transcriptional regulator